MLGQLPLPQQIAQQYAWANAMAKGQAKDHQTPRTFAGAFRFPAHLPGHSNTWDARAFKHRGCRGIQTPGVPDIQTPGMPGHSNTWDAGAFKHLGCRGIQTPGMPGHSNTWMPGHSNTWDAGTFKHLGCQGIQKPGTFARAFKDLAHLLGHILVNTGRITMPDSLIPRSLGTNPLTCPFHIIPESVGNVHCWLQYSFALVHEQIKGLCTITLSM